ncbi:hypothetical protein LPU83_pLPU83b_0581 (plasmid) [Rhizobium favelukesii]|uniref:Uncharacterized protein n=1 Tax=Rhizobium favelukesii TaxID=348824 RepID=W6S2B9_9HYPH|nr:hypothetical protein LPU83_pLPU83b_0581 [Rhizobium favelukesii]
MTFEVQADCRVGGRNQHLALNHDVTRINTIIDPMPRDGIFALLRQQRPRRCVRSRISWQRTVVIIESTSTRSPKHVRWQYERIGNGENPIYRLSLQKRAELFNAFHALDIGASRPLCEDGVVTQGRTNDVAHRYCQFSASDSKRTTANNDAGGDCPCCRIHVLIARLAGTAAHRRRPICHLYPPTKLGNSRPSRRAT